MTARVFVAGASGVLGRRVVALLVAAGHEVTANVRNDGVRRVAESAGATAVTVDLFDRAATAQLGDHHDAIVNVATAIPSGVSSSRRSGWAMNDRLRRLPAPLVRLGGDGFESIARSQRVSSESSTTATGSEPRVPVVDAWQN